MIGLADSVEVILVMKLVLVVLWFIVKLGVVEDIM